MARPTPRSESPLFDLPIDGESVGARELERFEEDPVDFVGGDDAPARKTKGQAAGASSSGADAGVGPRFLAGLADLAAHAFAGLIALFGAQALGIEAQLRHLPALGAFLLAFSFLYTAIPLAFWGRTAGMAWARLEARTSQGELLSFGQILRRWLGWLFTLALAGLPTLLCLVGGRSLADRLSGSRTRQN